MVIVDLALALVLSLSPVEVCVRTSSPLSVPVRNEKPKVSLTMEAVVPKKEWNRNMGV